MHATAVRVRESCGSGAVIRVELYDDAGARHLVWGGNDPTTGLNYLILNFPKTDFKTDRVKVTSGGAVLEKDVFPGGSKYQLSATGADASTVVALPGSGKNKPTSRRIAITLRGMPVHIRWPARVSVLA